MKIQVNSDRTIAVDAALTGFVEGEANRVLDRFAKHLTRVEVHVSDVDNKKSGVADKRCLIEVRPAGDRPMSASANASTTEAAVIGALGKMQRSLTTFFGRRGRPAQEVSMPVAVPKKAPATKAAPAAKKAAPVAGSTGKKSAAKKAAAKKAAVKKPTKLTPRGPKKKGIYQARRKARGV
jgi:ribosome-associated translation inhibitor RaiA